MRFQRYIQKTADGSDFVSRVSRVHPGLCRKWAHVDFVANEHMCVTRAFKCLCFHCCVCTGKRMHALGSFDHVTNHGALTHDSFGSTAMIFV